MRLSFLSAIINVLPAIVSAASITGGTQRESSDLIESKQAYDKVGNSGKVSSADVSNAINLIAREDEEYNSTIKLAEKEYRTTAELLLYCAEGSEFEYNFYLKWQTDFGKMLAKNYRTVENLERPEQLQNQINFVTKLYDAMNTAAEKMWRFEEPQNTGEEHIFKAYDLQIRGLSLNDVYGKPKVTAKWFSGAAKTLYDDCYELMNSFPKDATVEVTEEFREVITKAFEAVRPLRRAVIEENPFFSS